MPTYPTLFQHALLNPKNVNDKSYQWYLEQLKTLSKPNITARKIVGSDVLSTAKLIQVGEMYLYEYDPKHKDTLPIWDKFPLVFPFRAMNDGFIGLNMHYLPYPARIQLLDALMRHRTTLGLSERTRLSLSWNTIQAVAKAKLAGPCVHRYLRSHIMSPIKKIDARNWETALMLPIQKFIEKR